MAEGSDEFRARIGGVVNTAYAGFSIFLGHDVGLFDILAKDEKPRTSQEIADAGNLKERYVRELLNALVMAKIVELDTIGEQYFLPGHRAAALVHGDTTSGDLIMGSLLPMFGGGVYNRIKECFKMEGPRGVPYDMYEGGAMATIGRYSGPLIRNNLVEECASAYPELKGKLENGITVLDIGCGNGLSTITFGAAFPNSTFCGIDLLESSLKTGREMSAARDFKNVSFIAQDAANLPATWSDKYDFVFMFDTLHDQAYPDKVLSETRRVLAPSGICVIVDELSHSKVKDNLEKYDAPRMTALYTISLLHCMPVSLHFEGGMGLGTCWGREKAAEMLEAAGLELVRADDIPKMMMIKYYCEKP